MRCCLPEQFYRIDMGNDPNIPSLVDDIVVPFSVSTLPGCRSLKGAPGQPMERICTGPSPEFGVD